MSEKKNFCSRKKFLIRIFYETDKKRKKFFFWVWSLIGGCGPEAEVTMGVIYWGM